MNNIQNVNNSRPVVQVDGRIVKQNAAGQQAPLRPLENGERISGKILSLIDESGSKNAQILLGDDAVISAKLSEGMSLKEGQYVSFEVRGANSGKITLTPLFENTAMEQTAMKALAAAGLEPNAENLGMVKTMMEHGMSIDKNSLYSMQQTFSAHPDTSMSTLVQMKALQLPITEQNITQFESYKNYEHQVVETMNSIMDDLPQAYEQLTESGEGAKANDLYGDILKMLSDGTEKMQQTGLSEAQVPVEGKVSEESLLMNPENGTVVSEGGLEGEAVTNNIQNQQSEKFTAVVQNESNAALPENGEGSTGKIQNNNLNNSGMSASEFNDQSENTLNTVSSRNIFLSNDFAKLVKELQSDAGLTGPEISKIISQAGNKEGVTVDEGALLKELSEAYEKNAHADESAENAFSKLFGNSEYNKIMKNSMRNQWMMEPREVGSKENVENLYSRLNAQAKQLTETLTNTLGADSRVAQSASNLQNNIDFMNQLNQMFNYIQLPLKMAEQDAHGELYVYSNGRKKFEPGESVSAILHLDMDNLGPLDVYVRMKNNDVKTNFYVADEETIDLIAEHIDILNERLNKRGYSMEAHMHLHTDMDTESEDAAVSEMLNIKQRPVISMQAFDARA